jgi:alanyl-tRNA synthetase
MDPEERWTVAVVTRPRERLVVAYSPLVKFVAGPLGGGGGGRPTLAQAGGKDASRLDEALETVFGWVETYLKD